MMAKSTASEAERFRVEDGWEIKRKFEGYAVARFISPGSAFEDGRYLLKNGKVVTRQEYIADRFIIDSDNQFPTEAEATFRLLLYTDPRQALQPFLEHDSRGGIIEYEGTCEMCGGSWPTHTTDQCPACHGTGGQPAEHLLAGAADFWEGDFRGDVCRGLIKKGNDDE